MSVFAKDDADGEEDNDGNNGFIDLNSDGVISENKKVIDKDNTNGCY